MKHLYFAGGPMGVGKTTACQELQKRLDRRVFLVVDVRAGRRGREALARSLGYLPLYSALDTEKLDISHLTPEEAAARLEELW